MSRALSGAEGNKFHRSNFVPKGNVNTFFYDFLRQSIIKIGPRNLPGMVPTRGMFFCKIEITHNPIFQKSGTCLYFEILFIQTIQKPRFLKVVHTARQQAFANYKARKGAFFNYFAIYSIVF